MFARIVKEVWSSEMAILEDLKDVVIFRNVSLRLTWTDFDVGIIFRFWQPNRFYDINDIFSWLGLS